MPAWFNTRMCGRTLRDLAERVDLNEADQITMFNRLHNIHDRRQALEDQAQTLSREGSDLSTLMTGVKAMPDSAQRASVLATLSSKAEMHDQAVKDHEAEKVKVAAMYAKAQQDNNKQQMDNAKQMRYWQKAFNQHCAEMGQMPK